MKNDNRDRHAVKCARSLWLGRTLLAWCLSMLSAWPVMASPVHPEISKSYLRSWSGAIHYCRAGLCLKLGRRDMPQADRASFRPLSERYAADQNRVYYEGREVQGADPQTLRVLGPDHAADRHALFVKGFRVREADAATARYLPRHYVLDRHKVWYGEFESDRSQYVLRELPGADPARFHLPDPDRDTLGTDGQRLFLGQKVLPLTLGKDFRLLESKSLLAFVSDTRLHVLAYGLQWPDASAVREAGTAQRSTWLSLPGSPSVQGDGPWRLLNGRWLIVEQERRWRLLGDRVQRLTTFDESIWYAVADGALWYVPPRHETPAFEIGPAAADLRFLNPHHLINNGQVFHNGRPVAGADAASFQAAPERTFRFSVDALDKQWLYGRGERVDSNDEEGRRRHSMPR
jgi:hypothetical protein